MKLKHLLETRKFTLEVTGAHTVECVQAVLKGGAEVLKMRCNVTHTDELSGVLNGPFQERKGFLREVIRMAGSVPVGLVPGGKDAFITEAERFEMEEMGFDFFNIHYKFVPGFMFESKVLDSVIAIDYDNYDSMILNGIDCSRKVDVIEASFVPRADFGTRLVYEDILRYTSIVKKLRQPIIATGQRRILPSEVRHFYEAGCKALMIGNVAFIADSPDGKPTPDTYLRTTAAFREAIDKL